MIKELKPCPFCGADYHSLYFVMTGDYVVGIFCDICKQTVTLEDVVGIFGDIYKQTVTLKKNEIEGDTEETTRARAIKAWNRRESSDNQGAV